AATAIDEGIEHQVEELAAELECRGLCAGRSLSGNLVEGSGEIATGEAKERHEGRRQRAAVVKEVVYRTADVDLVDGEERRRRWQCRSTRYGWDRYWRVRIGNKLGLKIKY